MIRSNDLHRLRLYYRGKKRARSLKGCAHVEKNQSFEEMLTAFRPLIFHIMKTLNIYTDQDEFFQIAAIALWKASINYDEQKGRFATYAYATIKGSLMTELRKKQTYKERHVLHANDIIAAKLEFFPYTDIEARDLYERIAPALSDAQRIWFTMYFFEGKTQKEIAEELNVTVNKVKNWRKGALKKLKKYAVKVREEQ